jgi:hypothetical protein
MQFCIHLPTFRSNLPSLYLGQILLNQIVAYRYVKHKIFMNALDEIEKDTYYLEEQNIDGL